MLIFGVQQKQKLAENTLKELYRKKQELKTERAAVEEQAQRFKRMEREYNQFVVEKKRLRKEKQLHLREQKKLTVVASNRTRAAMLEAAHLQEERDRVQKSKAVLHHKHRVLTSQGMDCAIFLVQSVFTKIFGECLEIMAFQRNGS